MCAGTQPSSGKTGRERAVPGKGASSFRRSGALIFLVALVVLVLMVSSSAAGAAQALHFFDEPSGGADGRFSGLAIRHDETAIPMVEAAFERTDRL